MERANRTRCVLLGLLCLMPALFFWALKSIPLELDTQPVLRLFGGASQMEFIVCGLIFPLLAVGLGWNAYRRCENKTFSLIVVAVGLVEFLAALITAVLGVGF